MKPLEEHDPRVIGPYRLLARLGAGGMGQVFLGTGADGVFVAVKVVHPAFAHEQQFRLRFRREVEVARLVSGPFVAAVVDADPDAPTPWLATEYVDGRSLDEAVAVDGPLSAQEARHLAVGLAQALRAIHAAGVVHRDLKPSNVLLTDDGPRVIDFGVSRAVDSTRVTVTGAAVGTPAFMSPEQIAGEETGPASDMFSLGSVVYFAATADHPFGETPLVALIARIATDEPDLSLLPDELRGPVAACLIKRPADRATPEELGWMLAAEPGSRPAVHRLPTDPGDSDTPVTEVPAGPPRRIGRRAVLGAVGVAAGTAAVWAVLDVPPDAPPPAAPDPVAEAHRMVAELGTGVTLDRFSTVLGRTPDISRPIGVFQEQLWIDELCAVQALTGDPGVVAYSVTTRDPRFQPPIAIFETPLGTVPIKDIFGPDETDVLVSSITGTLKGVFWYSEAIPHSGASGYRAVVLTDSDAGYSTPGGPVLTEVDLFTSPDPGNEDGPFVGLPTSDPNVATMRSLPPTTFTVIGHQIQLRDIPLDLRFGPTFDDLQSVP